MNKKIEKLISKLDKKRAAVEVAFENLNIATDDLLGEMEEQDEKAYALAAAAAIKKEKKTK